MYRSSMQTQPRTLRSSPGHSSAQLPARGERTSSLHDVIQPLRIDDVRKRSMRARARFTWRLTDKGLETPECRMCGIVASPFTWALAKCR